MHHLLYHYLRGENPKKALQYLELSGDKAARSYAIHEAYRFYCETIEVLAKMPETGRSKRRQIAIFLPRP